MRSGVIVILVVIGMGFVFSGGKAMQNQEQARVIELAQPKTKSGFSLEAALEQRLSIRSFKDEPVSLAAVSQLLWAAQGITHGSGYRTAPSAGALYPLEVYVVAGNVTGLAPGIYHYRTRQHVLVEITAGDHRQTLYRHALRQTSISNAPLSFVIAGIPGRTTGKYGDRGMRYVYMEAGHAAQNLCLQAVALELGSVAIGAFLDREVGKMLQLGEEGVPLYIIPVGRAE